MLLVDTAQGIEAQTLANLYAAINADLHIIPVLNKIDLPSAPARQVRRGTRVDHRLRDPDDVLRVSAKTGGGGRRTPGAHRGGGAASHRRPRGPGTSADLRLHLRHLPRGDHPRPRDQRQPAPSREGEDDVDRRRPRDAGGRGDLAGPDPVAVAGTSARSATSSPASRRSGSRGWATPSPTAARQATEPLAGYRHPNPMVFAGLFPIDGDEYPELREALEKLQLNDAALVYEPETLRGARLRLPLRVPRPAAHGDRAASASSASSTST